LKLTDTISYHGSVQGIITALFKDRTIYSKPHFRLRELYSDELIPCYYSYGLYEQVIEVLHDEEAIVHVAGNILASRNDRKPLQMQVKKMVSAEPYLEGDLEKFIGCSPDATGDLSTEEYIDLVRGRESEEEFEEIT
jgi:hypothetical protein